ncbi:MAG: Kazal-type serine protease inhibitor domain protein [Myxococcaceae bacterium]|nr:Kazal-type serine protease inhibitor domain protein [Myxococcaceae bacterium]
MGLVLLGAFAALPLGACDSDQARSEAEPHARPDAGASAPDAQRPLPDAAAPDVGSAVPVDAGGSDLCLQRRPDGGCAASDRPDASSSSDAGDESDVSCDPHVECKRAPPDCPSGQLPQVIDTCWGDCVKAERCVCHSADQCPQSDQYACHLSAGHCGPYVN